MKSNKSNNSSHMMMSTKYQNTVECKKNEILDMRLSISNDIVSTKIYDKRDDFAFKIVNFLFFDGDFPRSTSYGVYIPQFICFARSSSHVADFNTRNTLLTQKLLKQCWRCYDQINNIPHFKIGSLPT